jgi:Flp pilus assembly protein TadD
VTIAAIVLIALVAAWVTVQPLRSFDADNAAVAAAIRGDGAGALTKARAAAADDPVSIDPLVLLSRIYTQLGDQGAARRELVKATTVQPSNPAVWENLGCYDLGRHLASSAPEFRRALALEPGQAQLRTDPTGFCVSITG